MDSRAFHDKPPLRKVHDFVTINSTLHDEFESFKASAIKNPSHSFVELNELLSVYCLSTSNLLCTKVEKFGKIYMELQAAQMDILIEWVLELRGKYKHEGDSIFATGAQSLLTKDKTSNYNLTGDPCIYITIIM